MRRLLFGLSLLGLLVGSAAAQTADPGYLSQFPVVDQVEKEMKGDSQDLIARRIGLYWQMYNLIYIMARADHRDAGHFSDGENKLRATYMHFYSSEREAEDNLLGLGTPAQDAWYRLHMRYQDDHGYRDEIFGKYFDDDFRAQIYKVLGEAMPVIARPKPNPTLAASYLVQARNHRTKADELNAAKKAEAADLEYRAAIADYQSACDADPTNADALSECSEFLINLGQYEAALKMLAKLHALKPDDDGVDGSIGIAQYSMGQPDDATATFAKILAKPKAKPLFLSIAHHWTGKVLLDAKKYEEAIAHFQAALKLVKDDSRTNDDLGFAYFSLKRYPEAIAAYKEAIRLDPHAGKSYGQLVFCYIAVGNKDEAAATLAKLKTVDPALYDQFIKQGGGSS